MRKPPKNRAWRKLHLVVDANTGDVAACDLGSSQARDAARVPALLKQVERPLAWVAADSAYDTEGVYAAIERHREGRSPRVLIPDRGRWRVVRERFGLTAIKSFEAGYCGTPTLARATTYGDRATKELATPRLARAAWTLHGWHGQRGHSTEIHPVVMVQTRLEKPV